MYESSMRVSELIDLARASADIAPEIDDDYYLLWLNSLESLIYTGILRQSVIRECTVYDGVIDLALLQPEAGEAMPRGCDVRSVYLGARELVRVGADVFLAHPEKSCFYTLGDKVHLNCPYGVGSRARVAVTVRPERKGEDGMSAYVALPDEFLPMALDYLVGCAYALICEDNQAANRFASYNAALDAFTEWVRKNEGGKE